MNIAEVKRSGHIHSAPTMKPILLLTGKSTKNILRDASLIYLIVFSMLIVLGGLYSMWILSHGQNQTFMTSNSYSKLAFDILCKMDYARDDNMVSSCHPTADAYDSSFTSADLSPADLFFNMYGGTVVSNKTTSVYANDIVKLLSSAMMNGLPLVGLNDFIHLSDIANDQIGSKGRDEILGIAMLRDKFGNFLDVRQKELRVTPRNCWTKGLLRHFQRTTSTFKEIKVRVYDDMESAVEDCCENVWAVIELLDLSGKDNCTSAGDWKHDQYGYFSDLHEIKTTDNVSNRLQEKLVPFEKTKLDQRIQSESLTAAANVWPGPALTIRMVPSAVSDTRNFE